MGDEVIVESGVPIPRKQNEGAAKYPWTRMSVGDSFFVAGARQKPVSAAVWCRSKNHPGERYTTRQMPDGVRVWRTA